MDSFYTYVLIVALVLLILILVVVGVVLSKLKKTDLYPPVQATCPDYWDVSANPDYCGLYVKTQTGVQNKGNLNVVPVVGKEKYIIATDPNNVGFCTTGSTFGCKSRGKPYIPTDGGFVPGMSDFQYVKLNNNSALSSVLYPGTTDRCAKKRWADAMGITWDGVTNFNGC